MGITLRLYPMQADLLTVWTVFYNTSDYPGLYALRAFHESNGQILANPVIHTADSLDGIRAKIPPGCFRLPAMPGDDPTVVEAWF